jgi:hypothetical protein
VLIAELIIILINIFYNSPRGYNILLVLINNRSRYNYKIEIIFKASLPYFLKRII